MSSVVVTSLRCVAGAVLAALVVAGCGRTGTPAPRYAVSSRAPLFEAAPAPSPPVPLGRHWTFDADETAWSVQAPGRSRREGDHLLAYSLDTVAVLGPTGGGIDPELHHWLVIEARVGPGTETLTVQWRAAGDDFAPERQTAPIPLRGASDEVVPHAIRLSQLRGIAGGKDAVEGVDELRLVFAGRPGARPRVELHAIRLLSDLDDDTGDALPLQRHGVTRRGMALRLPGQLRARFVPAEGERLRFGLALAGSADPLDVHVVAQPGDAAVAHTLASIRLQPGAPWTDVALDLAPYAGSATSLVVRPAADEAHASLDPRATLWLGGVLRMTPEPADAPRPNVLLYVEDTLRADRLSIHGYAHGTDPRLARMAADGTVFTRAVAPSSWTRPAASTLMTSLDPLHHGNGTHLRRIPEHVTTLAEALAAEGYLTTSFVTNYHAGAWSGLERGFDVAREPNADGAAHIASTLTSAAVAPSIEAFLAEHQDERVFVYVHSFDPHEPYEPPQQDMDALASTRASRPRLSAPFAGDLSDASFRYDAEIHHNDRMLGRLDDVLARLALRDRTLFVFTSDHGEAFGEHGQAGHRRSLYQEELAVPLVLRGPGVARGVRRPEWTGLIDVAPTLLGLVGGTVPESWQGRDLSSSLRGDDGAVPPRDAPLLAHVIYDEPRGGHLEHIAVLHEGRKLICAVMIDGGLLPRALHDLRTDPAERVDLLADPDIETRRIADALLAFAAARMASARDAAVDGSAEPMDGGLRAWMIQMGYLQDDQR